MFKFKSTQSSAVLFGKKDNYMVVAVVVVVKRSKQLRGRGCGRGEGDCGAGGGGEGGGEGAGGGNFQTRISFTQNEHVRAYKQARRKEDDTSIVNAAMRVVFRPGTSCVEAFHVAYGGMSSTTVVPTTVTSELVGRSVLFVFCLYSSLMC